MFSRFVLQKLLPNSRVFKVFNILLVKLSSLTAMLPPRVAENRVNLKCTENAKKNLGVATCHLFPLFPCSDMSPARKPRDVYRIYVSYSFDQTGHLLFPACLSLGSIKCFRRTNTDMESSTKHSKVRKD